MIVKEGKAEDEVHVRLARLGRVHGPYLIAAQTVQTSKKKSLRASPTSTRLSGMA